MDEDDPTPRHKRPVSHWDDDRRAAVGRDRRVAPARGVPIRDQVDELAGALPLPPSPDDDDPITGPQEIERDYGPLTPQNDAIWKRIDRHRREENARWRALEQRHKDTQDRILKAMGDRPPAERLAVLETRVKQLLAALGLVVSLVLGEALTIVKGIYQRGETDGVHEQRLEQVEKQVDRLEQTFFPPAQVRHLFGKDSQ